MRSFSWLCLAIAFFAVSCASQKKNVASSYLQNVRDTVAPDSIKISTIIQKNDLLSIRVYSAALGLKPEADAPYNLPETGTAATGFLVDINGNISYPQLGTLHVEGLTKEQLSGMIAERLEGQLTKPTVVVRFINYRITVLGEVKNPSTFVLPVDHVTILEALGLAGDVTDFGRRDHVKVIRDNNGQREVGSLDLTTDSMFHSPYFQLQQNDVVIVEQSRRKSKQQDQQTLIQQVGIATSVITAVALILNFLR